MSIFLANLADSISGILHRTFIEKTMLSVSSSFKLLMMLQLTVQFIILRKTALWERTHKQLTGKRL